MFYGRRQRQAEERAALAEEQQRAIDDEAAALFASMDRTRTGDGTPQYPPTRVAHRG